MNQFPNHVAGVHLVADANAYVAASPIRSILDYAEFTLSQPSESNGLRSE